MTSTPATIPTNVFYFEVLLYLSLAIDALSMPFRDESFENLPDMSASTGKLITAVLIGLFIYLVWLAAHRRKNWPRMVLLASLVMSLLSIAAAIKQTGLEIETVVDAISAFLTALGMYLSFTGDAVGWFGRSATKP